MTFAELAIGERFTFDPWSLDWLNAMGPQIKTGEAECGCPDRRAHHRLQS